MPLVLDLILGRTTDVEFIVGGAVEERAPRTDTLHELSSALVINNQGRFLVVNIRLFALLGAPDYHVVVGRLTPEMEERLRGTPSGDPNPAITSLADR